MPIVSRKVFLAAVAVSVLAGCKTTTNRECDTIKPNVTYGGKCCGIGGAPCPKIIGGGGGGGHDHSPTPTPQ
jgi:hypothetical protein